MDIETRDFAYILQDKNINFEEFSGKTVLITGASGMLPAYIAKTLLYLNSLEKYPPTKIICVVRNIQNAKRCFYDFLDDENLIILNHDIEKPLKIDENIDYIIHAASKASGKYFYSNPADVICANTIGTYNMLNLAKEKNVKSFLYFSSGEACGDIFLKKDLVKEADYGIIDPYDVRNSYALSKKMGECMCYCWFKQYNIPTKTIRPSHTYGPGFKENDDRAFAQFTMCAVNDKDIVLTSDGSAKRSFVYIADATRAYFNVLLNGKNGEAYNVGNSKEISIKDLAYTIKELTHNKIDVIINSQTTNQSSESPHGQLDITKIKNLGWSPLIDEKEGFKRTIEFYKNKKIYENNYMTYMWEQT